MLGSRRLLVIGVVVVGLVLLAILATFLTSSSRNPSRNACEKLLDYAIKGQYDKSYELLSSSAKGTESKESWRSKMFGLANVYKNAKVTYTDQSAVSKAPNDTKDVQRFLLRYVLTNPAATTDISCYIRDDGKATTVDGLVSQVRS
jgi:hypothetical protein